MILWLTQGSLSESGSKVKDNQERYYPPTWARASAANGVLR